MPSRPIDRKTIRPSFRYWDVGARRLLAKKFFLGDSNDSFQTVRFAPPQPHLGRPCSCRNKRCDQWEGIRLDAVGLALKRSGDDQMLELLERHRRGNHADKVAVATDIDQAETKIAISIKEQMMKFVVGN